MLQKALLLSLCSVVAAAQQPSESQKKLPIQDNSFLVEEAYNQEAGVVQHVSTFSRQSGSASWAYGFTQEWPVGGQRHQLSYTLPIVRVDETPGAGAGIGDVALHYRYQLLGIGGASVALAPRVSAMLPTGSSRRGLGAGGTGVQLNIPLSIALSASVVTHSNGGMTYTRRAQDPLGARAVTTAYNAAQSVIWLAHPKLNLMLEGAWSRSEEVVAAGRTVRQTEVLLSPGVRGAIDFPSGLQIVPGVAFPIGVGPSRGDRSVFFYLSFEHPFAGATP